MQPTGESFLRLLSPFILLHVLEKEYLVVDSQPEIKAKKAKGHPPYTTRHTDVGEKSVLLPGLGVLRSRLVSTLNST
jgi:hypothetical protein